MIKALVSIAALIPIAWLLERFAFPPVKTGEGSHPVQGGEG